MSVEATWNGSTKSSVALVISEDEIKAEEVDVVGSKYVPTRQLVAPF